MNEDKLRQALKTGLSGADFSAHRQRAVINAIKGETPMKPTKISFALVCALILSLLMAGAALAAALGIFGSLGDVYTSSRMQKLDEVSESVNLNAVLSVPAYEKAPEPETVYDQLLSRQYGRTFDLTIHQTYCDGNRLYYSYTLKTNDAEVFRGEGMPTGFAEWTIGQPGMRYVDVWSNDIPQRDEEIIAWLDSCDAGWIAHETWDLGDGARTADGEYCEITGSETRRVDPYTIQGYQEVILPEGAAAEDGLTIELSVLYGASLYYQDETGVYFAHVAAPENRGILRIPVEISLNGQARQLSGQFTGEGYSAEAEVLVSDVDLSGRVLLHCPDEWTESVTNWESGTDYLEHYVLVSNGKALRNLDVSLQVLSPGEMELSMRFDLPERLNGLSLRPVYFHSGEHPEEDIPLQ